MTDNTRTIQDQFNVTATPDGGISATYKDPGQAQKHIYYIAYDLIDLSRAFNDKPVSYDHVGHALSVTSADKPKDVEAKIPAKDQWPAGPKR